MEEMNKVKETVKDVMYEVASRRDLNKFVICKFVRSEKHKGYRAMLQNMTFVNNLLSGEGWFNTFAYTKSPTLHKKRNPENAEIYNDEHGIWLAKIIEVRKDKESHLNFVVDPIDRLGDDMDEIIDSPALNYLRMSGAFATMYILDQKIHHTFNTEEVIRHVVSGSPLLNDTSAWPVLSSIIDDATDDIKELMGSHSVSLEYLDWLALNLVVDKVCRGAIGIADLNNWLTTPSKYDILAKMWKTNTDDMENQYPHTAKRIPYLMYRCGKIGESELSHSDRLEDLLENWDEAAAFDNGVHRSIYIFEENSALDAQARIEASWKARDAVYDEKREREKEARKARRLARKKKGN